MDENRFLDIDQILERFDNDDTLDALDPSDSNGNHPVRNAATSSMLENVDEVSLLSLNRSLLTLQSAFSAVASSIGSDQVLETLAWEMTSLLQAEGCLVFMSDHSSNDPGLIASYPSLKHDHLVGHSLQSDLSAHGPIQRVVEEKCAYQINSSSHRAEGDSIALLRRFSAESMMILPMVFQARSLGLIIVLENCDLRTFTDQEISLAQLLTDQATGVMVNAQLYQRLARANDQLAVMNVELDSFAHSVAHNLKNPLSNIIGFTQMLLVSLEEYSTEELDECLGHIGDSAAKIGEIIDSLLLLASIRREEVVFEPLDMAPIVDEALSTISSLIDEYKPTISVPNGWPISWGNHNWVEQILVNFLSNGLKYGGQPPILELGAKAEPDGMVKIWVADNGPGLTQKEQDSLFKPFTRLSRSRAKGHGLGLSIVQNMVVKLGGQVGVESKPGEGSLFYFTLPGTYPLERKHVH